MEIRENGQDKTKEEIIEILNSNGISHLTINCDGCDIICIFLDNKACDCGNCTITIQTCNKDIFKISSRDILYIAIEDRKSVIYLTDKKIETHYTIEHWKDILDNKTFAQPHYSYIVNLNYVAEVTKDFVVIKYGKQEYKVYTSLRKLGAFKKAVLELDK